MRRQRIEVVGNRVGKRTSARKSRGMVIGGTVEDPSGGSNGVVEVGSTSGAVAELPLGCGRPEKQRSMDGRRYVGIRRERNGNEEASGRWRLSLGDLVDDS